MVCHTAIVFTRYTLFEWIRRNENDQKTYGELFFLLCDDIQDMDLTTALKSLMALFVEHLNHKPTTENANNTKSQLINWIGSQPLFIQALFGNLKWES